MATRGTSVVLVLAMLLAGASAARELQGHTYTAGGSCTAVGDSAQYGYVEDVWGKACAAAMEYACSIDGTEDGKVIIDKMEDFFHGYATAVADVWVSALAKCTSFGKYSSGCAYAHAQADKQVQATIKVYADAYARAWNSCKRCDPVAQADMFTKLIVVITARAKAHAEALACVQGTDSALSRSSVECWAASTARACAYAFAKAVAKGGCMGQKAKAKVVAFVKVTVDDPICECTYWKKDAHGTMTWHNPPPSIGTCKFHDYAV